MAKQQKQQPERKVYVTIRSTTQRKAVKFECWRYWEIVGGADIQERRPAGRLRCRQMVWALRKTGRPAGACARHNDGGKRNMTDTELSRIEAICETANVKDIGDVSDGYHTFNGLYYQRMILFAALVKAYKDKAWKSHRHEDGELCFGGSWFIVGIDTPEGSFTYHYEDKDLDRFDCQELPVAKHWDGHREENVTRLLSLPETSINEKTALAMMAGSHAIRKHAKRYAGTTYMWDVFGKCGGPKEISYLEAAKQLVSIANSVLDHEPPKEAPDA